MWMVWMVDVGSGPACAGQGGGAGDERSNYACMGFEGGEGVGGISHQGKELSHSSRHGTH